MKSMERAVIVDALRTPIGRYRGALKDVRPDDLAALVLAQSVLRNGLDPAAIEDVYFGDANQAGEDNRNVARMAVLLAGLPVEIPAATMNRLCGSGMQAIVSATRELETGNGDLFLAGGVESMTRAPYVLEKPQQEFPRGPQTLHDTTIGWRMINPRLAARYPPISLGQTAEVVARRYGISREAQDRFALESHQRAIAAQEACHFKSELIPVPLPDGSLLETDEGPRRDTSLKKLASLKPAFEKDGSVTAGNSSPINDGAACLTLMSEPYATKLGLQPKARVLAAASAGVDPSCMGLGPIPATRKALRRAGLRIDDLRRHRAQRSLRLPGACLYAGTGFRSAACQPERRGDRPRSSAGGERGPHHGDPGPRTGSPKGPLRTCDDVHRRGTGNCVGDRKPGPIGRRRNSVSELRQQVRHPGPILRHDHLGDRNGIRNPVDISTPGAGAARRRLRHRGGHGADRRGGGRREPCGGRRRVVEPAAGNPRR